MMYTETRMTISLPSIPSRHRTLSLYVMLAAIPPPRQVTLPIHRY